MATIYVGDDKLTQTVTFQTHQIRHFSEVSSEVLMVDSTHNTNDARYKHFSVMIHDVFGHLFVINGDNMIWTMSWKMRGPHLLQVILPI
ncbi:hypothetical protein PF005_g1959 [Phytophthora fragariae]|uniref:ZSWIM1/3 RNaseH-like domain-containing protein n=1 Tax=Phytophthora fragariae TaxID=53985 RepID=A0A6A3UV94_9STRA|nr:hypothetical protein PF009_g1896 [Phytophthora fragariae]KAE9128924.1 hypothetical protein PF010_g4322 [Phytophthora fragariae]KAE9154532.1 hypothetical protein PF006_g1449 [Phytophthora fragariae]KAE9234310.1 hypothetical protein PF005_g1959 [Phytophthora fragariae]KAE9253528.1 hypothetical protein PF004_g1476 [Phytophthora fragariae]